MPCLLRFIAIAALAFGACSKQAASGTKGSYKHRDGDMIFQSFPHNALIDAIEGSTESPYSHCGMLLQKNGDWFVLEAVGPVKETPLNAWIAQGRDSAYTVYRLRPPLVGKVPAILDAAARYKGRPYDHHYALDDERIYCSELLYKAVRDAVGVKLGTLRKLGELKWQPFEKVIREVENGELPLDREMITPRALSEAPELEQVYRHRM